MLLLGYLRDLSEGQQEAQASGSLSAKCSVGLVVAKPPPSDSTLTRLKERIEKQRKQGLLEGPPVEVVAMVRSRPPGARSGITCLRKRGGNLPRVRLLLPLG